MNKSNESHVPFNLNSDELIPLLTIDSLVNTENLNYMFDKPDLVNEMWKIINWNMVAKRFKFAKGCK